MDSKYSFWWRFETILYFNIFLLASLSWYDWHTCVFRGVSLPPGQPYRVVLGDMVSSEKQKTHNKNIIYFKLCYIMLRSGEITWNISMWTLYQTLLNRRPQMYSSLAGQLTSWGTCQRFVFVHTRTSTRTHSKTRKLYWGELYHWMQIINFV